MGLNADWEECVVAYLELLFLRIPVLFSENRDNVVNIVN